MILPLKTTRQIALGWVTGRYEYRADEQDLAKRHVIPVEWKRQDLPRSAVKQDLLFTLGSAMSVFSPSKNNAVARLESLLSTAWIQARQSPLTCETQAIGHVGE